MLPGVRQQERPRPVGVLGQPFADAPLAEQRGLLVSRDSRDRQRRPRSTPGRHSPTISADATTVGRISAGMPKSDSSSPSHARAARRYSIVRDALVWSVTWARPPVSRATSQSRSCPRPARHVPRDAADRRPAAAIRAWWRRSRDREPARSAPGSSPRAHSREAPGSAQRYAGPARRWPGRRAAGSGGPRAPPSPAGW